jgi:hypothetical protein
VTISVRAGGRRRAGAFSVTGRGADTEEVVLLRGGAVRFTPARAVAGAQVAVRGRGLPRRRTVVLGLGRGELARARTSRTGAFSASFALPADREQPALVVARVGGRRLPFVVTPFAPVIGAAGDIACAPDDPGFNGGAGTPEHCRQRDTGRLLLDAAPSAVVALGDIQYESGSAENYAASFDPAWGPLRAITHPALGNHDLGPRKDAAPYFGYFGASAGDPAKGYYSFDVGAWHLIALNSNCERDEFPVSCAAGGEQEQWLRADLRAHPNRCVLAYWHHPRYSSGPQATNRMDAMLRALLDAGADVVLNGHDHHYERFADQDADRRAAPGRGVRQFIVGTGGRDLIPTGRPVRNSEVRSASAFGVLLVTLHASSYDWRFVPVPGATFADSGSASCH